MTTSVLVSNSFVSASTSASTNVTSSLPAAFSDTLSDSDLLYTKLHNKKRLWTPPTTQNGEMHRGAENTLDRSLCLRKLEIPVGDFIKQGLGKEEKLSDVCMALLESNVTDEIKHDISLENLYRSSGQYNIKHETEAAQFVQAWLDLPDHPFLKAMISEKCLFFVMLPMMRFLSKNNYSMRTVASEISGDEIVHVAANTEVCKSLNLEPSKALNRLRRETVNWLVTDLTNEEPDTKVNPQYLDPTFWMRQSDNLYYNSTAPELNQTRSSRMPAFFESNRQVQATYA